MFVTYGKGWLIRTLNLVFSDFPLPLFSLLFKEKEAKRIEELEFIIGELPFKE